MLSLEAFVYNQYTSVREYHKVSPNAESLKNGDVLRHGSSFRSS